MALDQIAFRCTSPALKRLCRKHWTETCTNNAFALAVSMAETEETENVYLTESEVQALAEVKLPVGNLAQARDLF